jgi:hypothetical protein
MRTNLRNTLPNSKLVKFLKKVSRISRFHMSLHLIPPERLHLGAFATSFVGNTSRLNGRDGRHPHFRHERPVVDIRGFRASGLKLLSGIQRIDGLVGPNHGRGIGLLELELIPLEGESMPTFFTTHSHRARGSLARRVE